MNLLNRFHYEKLHAGNNPNKQPSLLLRLSLYLLPLLTTTLTLFLVLKSWSIPNIDLPTSTSPPSPVHTSCGTTPDEARSRGCHFDILSFAWQTHECYDAELMDDFMAYDNWTFYTQPNRTSKTVSLTDALKGDVSLFVDWKYHVVHCTFMWMQMHRAFVIKGWIDSHLDSYAHTKHCRWALLEKETKMEEVNVVAKVKYPACRRVKGIWGGEMQRGEEFSDGGKEHGHGGQGVYEL